MIAVQQTEDIFGIIHMNLCAWLNILRLGANVKGDDISLGGLQCVIV